MEPVRSSQRRQITHKRHVSMVDALIPSKQLPTPSISPASSPSPSPTPTTATTSATVPDVFDEVAKQQQHHHQRDGLSLVVKQTSMRIPQISLSRLHPPISPRSDPLFASHFADLEMPSDLSFSTSRSYLPSIATTGFNSSRSRTRDNLFSSS